MRHIWNMAKSLCLPFLSCQLWLNWRLVSGNARLSWTRLSQFHRDALKFVAEVVAFSWVVNFTLPPKVAAQTTQGCVTAKGERQKASDLLPLNVLPVQELRTTFLISKCHRYFCIWLYMSRNISLVSWKHHTYHIQFTIPELFSQQVPPVVLLSCGRCVATTPHLFPRPPPADGGAGPHGAPPASPAGWCRTPLFAWLWCPKGSSLELAPNLVGPSSLKKAETHGNKKC